MTDVQNYLNTQLSGLEKINMDNVKNIIKRDLGNKFFIGNIFIINFSQGLTMADKNIVSHISFTIPKIDDIVDDLKSYVLAVIFYFPLKNNTIEKNLNYLLKLTNKLDIYDGFIEVLQSINIDYIKYMTNPMALSNFLDGQNIFVADRPLNTKTIANNFFEILPIYFTYLVIKRQNNKCLISKQFLPSNPHGYITTHLNNAKLTLKNHQQTLVNAANDLSKEIAKAKENFHKTYNDYVSKSKAAFNKLYGHLTNAATVAKNKVSSKKSQPTKLIELQTIPKKN